jgi:hypothetical protein
MNKAKKIHISHSRLLEILSYDPCTGEFRWKVAPAKRVRAGSIAGCKKKRAWILSIESVKYAAHRIAWFYVHGEIDDGLVIDHANGDPLDNRIENLRLVTQSVNMQNMKGRSTRGVVWKKREQRWVARYHINGKRTEVGYYRTKDQAIEAYREATKDLGFTDRHRGLHL